jgi:hypothetical protein
MCYIQPVCFIWGSLDSCDSFQVFPVRHNYICIKGLVENCEKQLYFSFFVVFTYVYANSLSPVRYWQILVSSLYIVFRLKRFHTCVFYKDTQFKVLLLGLGNVHIGKNLICPKPRILNELGRYNKYVGLNFISWT